MGTRTERELIALLERGDVFTVLGRGKVTIFDEHDHSGKSFFVLTAWARYDLRKREAL